MFSYCPIFPDTLEERQHSSWHRLGGEITAKVCKLFSVCYMVGKKQTSVRNNSKQIKEMPET